MTKALPAPTTEQDGGVQETPSLHNDAALGARGDKPGLSLSELSDSDSDTIDVTRIIQSSDMLRSRLSHFIVPRPFEDDNGSSNNSIVPSSEAHSPNACRYSEQPSSELSGCESHTIQIGWNPPFLNGNSSHGLPTDADVNRQPNERSDFYNSLMQSAEHIYPFRKRLEKNLHPYTKGVWTNIDEAGMYRRAQQDMPAFDSQLRINQDDSEDDDYIPESPELLAAEDESQAVSFEMDSSQLPQLLPPPQSSTTYRHMAARRRKHASDLRKEQRRSSAISDSAGLRFGAESSESQAQNRSPAASRFGEHHPRSVHAQSHSHSSSSSLDELEDILNAPQARAHSATSPERGAAESHAQRSKRRRLVSRRKYGKMLDNESSADELPAERARKLSRRQIRGVLPFSFIRELQGENRDKQQSQHYRGSRLRALSSSPPPSLLQSRSTADAESDVAMASEPQSADEHSASAVTKELFSDPSSPPVRLEADDLRREPHFAFNFIDIYEWQYPPLAPVEYTGSAPDFLRVAARECRRRGIHAKTQADDPKRKHIAIEPRNVVDMESEDVAQGILMSWKMGVIDVRRVYFNDDSEESDSIDSLPVDPIEDGSNAIMISDDDAEAIEDNGAFDRMATARRSNSGRTRQPKRRRQTKLIAKPPSAYARGRNTSLPREPLLRPVSYERGHSSSGSRGKQPEAKGLDAVMGEFAAVDSDSDVDSHNLVAATKLPPPLLVDRHMNHMNSAQVRQQRFIGRFQRRSNGQSRDARRRNAVPRKQHRLAGNTKPARSVETHHGAEFLFDDDHEIGGHTAAEKKKRQTKLLSNPSARSGTGPSRADAVADRISKQRSTHLPAIQRLPAAKRSRATASYGTARKAVPTRVQMNRPTPVPDPVSDAADSDVPFAAGNGSSELGGLESGARFMSSTWVGRGGVRQIQQRLNRRNHEIASDIHYQYGDVLRIEMAASPAEFGQAYSMLWMLWHEQISNISVQVDGDSVLRWINFAQQYIAKPRTAATLARLASAMVPSIENALSRLNASSLVCGERAALAAAVGLAVTVSLRQLAVELDRARAVGHKGPRAVGDDDALAMVYDEEDIGARVDMAVAATVRWLSAACWSRQQGLSGLASQVWVALLHLIGGDIMWPALRKVCRQGSNQAQGLWALLAVVAPLTRVNEDGVAGPRVQGSMQGLVLRVAETAVEKQLQANSAELGAADEVAVRQAFFRAHSVVVEHGVAIPAGSAQLLLTQYRYLEHIGFRSLNIEPPPSLPRFFTRYSGRIDYRSGAADTCVVLWVRAQSAALDGWISQLQTTPDRQLLRDVRAAVSKMLPTRILTFTSATPAAQLSTLANYYAVFLLFLHSVPSSIVRATRLYTQFQTLLRFRDSASQTARRVYFEAWSAAVCIIGSRLRTALDGCGDVCGMSHKLVARVSTPPDIADYHRALSLAVSGWADALGSVLAGLSDSPHQQQQQQQQQLWVLIDAALMYVLRVLSSQMLSPHAPTIALILLELFRAQPLLDLLVWPENAEHMRAQSSVLEILRIWQAGHLPLPPAEVEQTTASNEPAAIDADAQEDSQAACLDMLDPNEMLAAAAAAEAMERHEAALAAHKATLREIHERYIPRVRLHVMSIFASTATTPLTGRSLRVLETTMTALALMVCECVASGLRTWQSFLDEHGRDSLHLVANWRGRRLVLVLFTVAAIDCMRIRRIPEDQQLLALAKDVWFASICDLSLTPYAHRLAAQLEWADRQQGTVFAHMPVDMRLLDADGILHRPLGRYSASGVDAPIDYEHRASLAMSCISSAVQAISAALRVSDSLGHSRKHVFSSWVTLLLTTQRQIRQSLLDASYALVDLRDLVDSMAERVTLLVRDHCAELFLPPNLVFQSR
ncbi:hypothetical protein EV183_001833 [Coemansia sp. RSA 2336]|nr:hypothetical protein EV183_001833 [Coemansia sp. RSA 2336]